MERGTRRSLGLAAPAGLDRAGGKAVEQHRRLLRNPSRCGYRGRGRPAVGPPGAAVSASTCTTGSNAASGRSPGSALARDRDGDLPVVAHCGSPPGTGWPRTSTFVSMRLPPQTVCYEVPQRSTVMDVSSAFGLLRRKAGSSQPSRSKSAFRSSFAFPVRAPFGALTTMCIRLLP